MIKINLIKVFKFLSNSSVLFKIIIGVFILEALYFSLFAAYPQAFDENFHFGIIQIYSKHLSPFLTKQPPGGDLYGALTRDPSYLYQYLMSFPYRLFAHFFNSQTAQIIFLRILNLILFTVGLIVFNKILLKVGLSQKLANIAIFIFILIPIVPQVAGQVNYDNLIFLASAIVFYLTLKIIDQINSKHIDATSVLNLITISVFSSLVKFEFMPIVLAIAIYLAWLSYKNFNHSIKKILTEFSASFKSKGTIYKVIVLILLVLSLVMFVQRDGYNLVKYHTISPQCDLVLSQTDCSRYSVWYHDYISHQLVATNAVNVNSNPIVYLAQWIYWIWYRLFFSVSGPNTDFRNYPPLPLPSAGFIIISLLSIYAVFKLKSKIFKINSYINLFFVVISIYLITLIYEGYKTYQYTGVLELMNGRYLLPIILPIAAGSLIFLTRVLKYRPKIKITLAILVIVLFIQGGGVLTFISRSDNDWIWSNPTVNKINKTAKKISNHIVVQGNRYYNSNVWFF